MDKQLWLAVFKDHDGDWHHISDDDGEIKMWDSKEDAEKGLKLHPWRHRVRFCSVEDHVG